MSHHHKKRRPTGEESLPQNVNENINPLGNLDFSSMLGNLNLDSVDFSKIDMNKVQSMMQNIKLPEASSEGTPGKQKNGLDPRISFLNSLKALLPGNRAKTVDDVTKFIQISQIFRPKQANKRSSKEQ